jgi:hypothetical protein
MSTCQPASDRTAKTRTRSTSLTVTYGSVSRALTAMHPILTPPNAGMLNQTEIGKNANK